MVLFTAAIACRHFGVQAAGCPDGSARLRVQLRLVDAPASRMVQRELLQEAAAIWRPYDVELTAADASPCDGKSIVCLTVRSAPAADIKGRSPDTVLGRAFIGFDDGFGGEPILVAPDAVARLLASREPSRTYPGTPGYDRELGRALGRVLAHEIGHVLLRERLHDADGLMRAHFLVDELAGIDRAPFRLNAESVRRLRAFGFATAASPATSGN